MILFVLFRVAIGFMFVISGGEKLIGPYQNFLYVIQSYEVFPPALEEAAARIVPWFELFTGVFLVLGLWTKQSLRAAMVLLIGFILIVSQAIIRDLPISECGCFGELASFPLHVVLMFDTIVFTINFVLLKKFGLTLCFSLDRFFGKS
jgi:uncharacterized membrane protein YphA (DoxX/SURF4 family)